MMSHSAHLGREGGREGEREGENEKEEGKKGKSQLMILYDVMVSYTHRL